MSLWAFIKKRKIAVILLSLLLLVYLLIFSNRHVEPEPDPEEPEVNNDPNHKSYRHSKKIIRVPLHGPVPLTTLARIFNRNLSTYNAQPRQHGTSIWKFPNFIQAEEQGSDDNPEFAVTYTTHADYTFLLENMPTLLKRWGGPISIAMYTPGTDFFHTLQRLLYLRECHPDGEAVKRFLSVHIFWFDKPPEKLSPEFVKLLVNPDCTSELLRKEALESGAEMERTFRLENGLLYPVNVARNIAKHESKTWYVLPSDIELYPSPGLIPRFSEMLMKTNAYQGDQNRLFVLPIFEVDGSIDVEQLPREKDELLQLLETGVAVPFHYKICKYCHIIPRFEGWVRNRHRTGLGVFHVAKRTGRFKRWEPIYIGTKGDPDYDERLSWEGIKDKMTQGFVLCTQGYRFHILDNAFLIHKPGIKVDPPAHDEKRKVIIEEQKKMIETVIFPELKLIYGEKKECVV